MTLMVDFKITSIIIYCMLTKKNIFQLLFFIYLSNYQHVIYSSYNDISGSFQNTNQSFSASSKKTISIWDRRRCRQVLLSPICPSFLIVFLMFTNYWRTSTASKMLGKHGLTSWRKDCSNEFGNNQRSTRASSPRAGSYSLYMLTMPF